MLRIALFTSSAIFFTTPLAAEQNFACQYTNSSGYSYKNGKWEPTGYFLRQPFFIKLDNGTLNPKSVYDALNIGFSTELPICFARNDYNGSYACASTVGETMTFNPETGEGAKATVYGAGNKGSNRDSIVVSTFVCQSM
jgi:hypothetical protein